METSAGTITVTVEIKGYLAHGARHGHMRANSERLLPSAAEMGGVPASKGLVVPWVDPFVRQVWVALAAPKAADKPEQVYVKQFRSALQWLHLFTTGYPQGLRRHCTR